VVTNVPHSCPIGTLHIHSQRNVTYTPYATYTSSKSSRQTSQQEAVRSTSSFSCTKGSSLYREHQPLKHIQEKLKPRTIGPLRILYVNKKQNNYTFILSIDSELSLINNTFHISKIKPYVENDSTNFSGNYGKQPYKVLEGDGKSKGYGSDDDKKINFEDIGFEIMQDFWPSRSYFNTFKQ